MSFDNATLTTVFEIRNSYRVVVPEFQRGFAWSQDQWKALWDDAVNISRKPHLDHYAGSIMLRPLSSQNGIDEVELVDGQQRLTSITLLMRALGEPGIAIRFRDNEPLQTYFEYFAESKVHLAPRLEKFRSFYTRNLQNAAEYFSLQAASIDHDTRQRVTSGLLHRFKLFTLGIQPTFDVHVAFETINNRGKPLSVLEKLKNRLIYLCSVSDDVNVGKSAALEVHKCWKEIYTWLGGGKKLLNDDEFLRAHSIGWFRRENKADWMTEQLFDEEFSTNKGEVNPETVVTYVRSLEVAAVWWHYLNEPDRLPFAAQEALERFSRTAFSGCRPVLLWALVRLSRGDGRLNSDPKCTDNWITPFLALITQTERFAVLVLYGNDRQANFGQSDLSRATYALAHPGMPLYPSLTDIPTPATDSIKAVNYIAAHVKSLIDNWNYEDDEDAVPADSRFPWFGGFSPREFINVSAAHMRKGTGFYNWHFGKLIIYEWEQLLRGDKGLTQKKPWEKFTWNESVEHIYPQSPDDGWSDTISLDGRTATSLRNAITNSLGNLLLLSGPRNSSLSNNVYFGGDDPERDKWYRYKAGSYSEWQVAEVCKKRWNVAAIAARGIAMMRFAQRRWNFQLVDGDKYVEWLPFLFGDHSEKIRLGIASHGVKMDGRALKSLVEGFEATRPG